MIEGGWMRVVSEGTVFWVVTAVSVLSLSMFVNWG